MLDRFEEDFIDEQLGIKDGQEDQWRIKDDAMAAWAVKKISIKDSVYESRIETLNRMAAEIQEGLRKAYKEHEEGTSFLKGKLGEYVHENISKARETKTQHVFSFGSSTVRLIKEKPVLEWNDEKLLELCKRDFPELIKTIEKPDKAVFKKKLAIEGDSILNVETGEIIEDEAVRVVIEPAKLKVEV